MISRYTALLREVWRQAAAGAATAGSSEPPLIAVESNAEAEMSAVGAYLTWLAFGAYDPHYTGNGHFVNMFAAGC